METPVINKKTKVYTIIGQPIALARPRFTQRNGAPHVFDSQAQAKAGTQIQLKFQHKDPIITYPMHINIAFFFGVTTRHKHGDPHSIKPDLDNLIKWVLDNSNGIIFKDDSLVVSLFASKYYDDYQRTEFTIREIYGR
jgi:Holliday junction resolvase RusA-like endonuclease